MGLTGFLVVANLTGCASAVSERGRGCLRAFDCSSSPNRSRGFGLGNGKGDGKHCRSTDNHPEKQTTIAKLIQKRQADVPHPPVPRRAVAPFASAPAAPGCRGGAPPRSFPDFSRVREIGPPEANSIIGKSHAPGREPSSDRKRVV